MVKHFILVFLLSLSTSSVFSQKQTLFTEKKYNEALSLSKLEKKSLVILFYAKWCPHCNKMKNEIFTDSTVTNLYRKNFICMAADVDTQNSKDLRTKFINQFKVTSCPTFAFIDSNENLLYCTSGEFKKEDFILEGKDVLLVENQLPTIKKEFQNEISNPNKCLNIITVRKAGLDATLITQKYFNTINEKERFSDINWKIFANGINNFDTDEFKFVVKNKEAFSKIVSPSRIDKKLLYTISETLKPYIETVDTINYDKKRLVAKSFQVRNIDSLVYRFDVQMLSQTENWRKYQAVNSANFEKFSWNDTVVLTDICNTYLEAINDKKGLLLAVNWSTHLLELSESKDRYVLKTKLLIKLKEYKQAAEVAKKGKTFVDGLGLNSDDINTLLEQIKKHT